MRAVVICGGNVGEYIRHHIRDDDFVICADSGYDRAAEHGIEPNVIIGDMDSVASKPDNINSIVYPSHKDCTDGELAVMYVKEHKFDKVILFGMIGTRIDHTLANISLLKQLKGIDAVIIDANNEIRYTEDEIVICGAPGDIVSVIPFDGDCADVSNDGLEYPLSHSVIKSGTGLGVSNVMLGNSCRITVGNGKAFIIRSKD